MATNKAIDAGRTFLSRLLAHVPAEARADVQKHLENEQVLTLAGQETLSRAELSRGMATLQGNQAALEEWYQKHLPILEAGKRALATPPARDPADLDDDDPDLQPRRRAAAPPVDTSQFIPRHEAEAALRTVEQNAMTLNGMTMRIGLNHFKEFNEVLDPDALMEYATDKRLRLDLAYNEMVAERREAARQAAVTAQVAAAREEGLQQGRASAAEALPYPLGNQIAEPLLPAADADRSHIGLQAALRTFATESAKAS